jgi:hypothetical protein
MEADVLAQYADLTATIAFICYLVNQNRRMGRQLTKMTTKYEELFERVLKAVE